MNIKIIIILVFYNKKDLNERLYKEIYNFAEMS